MKNENQTGPRLTTTHPADVFRFLAKRGSSSVRVKGAIPVFNSLADDVDELNRLMASGRAQTLLYFFVHGARQADIATATGWDAGQIGGLMPLVEPFLTEIHTIGRSRFYRFDFQSRGVKTLLAIDLLEKVMEESVPPLWPRGSSRFMSLYRKLLAIVESPLWVKVNVRLFSFSAAMLSQYAYAAVSNAVKDPSAEDDFRPFVEKLVYNVEMDMGVVLFDSFVDTYYLLFKELDPEVLEELLVGAFRGGGLRPSAPKSQIRRFVDFNGVLHGLFEEYVEKKVGPSLCVDASQIPLLNVPVPGLEPPKPKGL